MRERFESTMNTSTCTRSQGTQRQPELLSRRRRCVRSSALDQHMRRCPLDRWQPLVGGAEATAAAGRARIQVAARGRTRRGATRRPGSLQRRNVSEPCACRTLSPYCYGRGASRAGADLLLAYCGRRVTASTTLAKQQLADSCMHCSTSVYDMALHSSGGAQPVRTCVAGPTTRRSLQRRTRSPCRRSGCGAWTSWFSCGRCTGTSSARRGCSPCRRLSTSRQVRSGPPAASQLSHGNTRAQELSPSPGVHSCCFSAARTVAACL